MGAIGSHFLFFHMFLIVLMRSFRIMLPAFGNFVDIGREVIPCFSETRTTCHTNFKRVIFIFNTMHSIKAFLLLCTEFFMINTFYIRKAFPEKIIRVWFFYRLLILRLQFFHYFSWIGAKSERIYSLLQSWKNQG